MYYRFIKLGLQGVGHQFSRKKHYVSCTLRLFGMLVDTSYEKLACISTDSATNSVIIVLQIYVKVSSFLNFLNDLLVLFLTDVTHSGYIIKYCKFQVYIALHHG